MAKLVLHTETLASINRVVRERPQSLLLLGPKGAGKDAVTEFLMTQLLSVKAITTALPIHRVGNDADSSISIDAVRDAQHYLSRKGDHGSNGRIIVIASSERLGIEAQNALLKTLEEPPVASYIILQATSASDLLPTILSRMQTIEVKQPTPEALAKHFAEVGHSDVAIKRAMLMSGGLPGLMHGILTSDSSHPLLQASSTARDILRLDTFGRLAMIETLSKQRAYFLDILFILNQMARITLRDTSKPATSLVQWQTILRECTKAEQALRAQAQPKLVAMNLMLSL